MTAHLAVRSPVSLYLSKDLIMMSIILAFKVTYFYLFFLSVLNFLFCVWVQPINNVVIVSGGQQRDSTTHIHVSILPETPLPSRLTQNIE